MNAAPQSGPGSRVPSASFQEGARLGSYRIERLLGRGGMGAVYLAYDMKLHRRVALKVVGDGDGDSHSRVVREARNAAALNHPHICGIHEVGEDGGVSFIAMEYVDGRSLRDRLDAGGLKLDEALGLAIQAGEALGWAHDHSVVHRDFKAANIIVTAEGRLKIVDFGLARRKDALIAEMETTVSLVPAGSVAGTPYAMAPEQVRGKAADARTDIWALGVLVYEMVSGRVPFTGATAAELFAAILTHPPAPLPESVPAGLQSIVEKALEKEPGDRYQSMRELVVDLRRLSRSTGVTGLESAPHAAGLWWIAAVAMFALAGVALAAWLWPSGAAMPAERSEWVQLTNFPDSVTQPALSPDGRALVFLRGPGSFTTAGQVYVKMLPEGEPKALTNDSRLKMSPIFSPDGSRVVYTTDGWDTWSVPMLGGEPSRWLPNASGLAWNGRQRLVFSEVIDRLEGNHMKVVTADESRANQRDVYIPSPKGAMAHRSFPSPDGRWVIVAEMTDRGVWLPCRLLAVEGGTTGRQIGPPAGACWFAAWSPDGRWMYINSDAGGAFHIWRQQFSEGALQPPEQLTSGPTDEEGLAITPDGDALITAVGLRQQAVWLHDARGDRQVSAEGRASQPRFSPDGKTLFYVLERNDRTELWTVDVATGRTDAIFPGLEITLEGVSEPYDVSFDGRYVVVDGRDSQGSRRIWVAAVDRRSPPRPIPNVEGDGPVFGPDGEIFFRRQEGEYGFAYRVRQDGSGLRKAADYPVIQTRGVSPDGRWLVTYARYTPPGQPPVGATVVLPLDGGQFFRLFGPSGSRPAKWSPDRRFVFLSNASTSYAGRTGRTYAIPLAAGAMWPRVPEGGFRDEAEIAKVPGARVIGAHDAVPGAGPDVYAFSRETVQRNLYTIPLR